MEPPLPSSYGPDPKFPTRCTSARLEGFSGEVTESRTYCQAGRHGSQRVCWEGSKLWTERVSCSGRLCKEPCAPTYMSNLLHHHESLGELRPETSPSPLTAKIYQVSCHCKTPDDNHTRPENIDHHHIQPGKPDIEQRGSHEKLTNVTSLTNFYRIHVHSAAVCCQAQVHSQITYSIFFFLICVCVISHGKACTHACGIQSKG